MTDDRSLERAARSWIEAGPSRAPDRVVEAALHQIDTTPQERGLVLPRRFHPMTRFALAGAAVAFATIVAVVGLTQFRASPGPDVGAPSPSPSQPASAPSSSDFLSTLTVAFDSTIYRYSMGKDPDWIVTRATVGADSPAATDDNASDRFAVTGTDTTIGVMANELDGQSFDAWLADIHQAVLDDSSVPASCKNGDPSGWPAQQVGDKTGVLMTLCNFAQVFVEDDGQAYTFTWSNDTFEDASHLDVLDFERALETVTFQPAPTRPTPPPVFPTTPLAAPPGDALPADLIGRTYVADPPESHEEPGQILVLTLRPPDDPHCAAMYDGQSTCFTYLWTPNWPKHVNDPAARGAARIVDGNLVLRFDIVPNDPDCEGESATYAIDDDGAALPGVDAPACTVPGFIEQ